jgi:hypothetical protein
VLYPVRILAQTLANIAAKLTPSIRLAKTSHANSTLGGAPPYAATTGATLGAGASSEVTTTTIAELLSCLLVASFPWSISTVVTLQNEFLS